MHRIPGSCTRRKKVCSWHQPGQFIGSQIVGLGSAPLLYLVYAFLVIVVIQTNAGLSDRFSGFVEHFAPDHGIGRQLQHQRFGIESRSRDDCRRELIVLIIRGSDESAFRASRSLDQRTWRNVWGINATDSGGLVRPGDSGAPVKLENGGAVLGQVVAAYGMILASGRYQMALVQDISTMVDFVRTHYSLSAVSIE